MAHRPTQGTDSAQPGGPDPAKPENFVKNSASQPRPAGEPSPQTLRATDFAELAAKFATHGGGKIPAELSGELALDLLLNEIAEQACLATGASGAAIALRRDDAIVCRATTGTSAPELGTRLDTSSGLSGACVRTGKIQSCDDAWNDDRADADLSHQLGVRSVVVYPLARGKEFLGILEILSPLPSAFTPRDLQTLEALASRVVKNTEVAREISLVPTAPAPAERVAETISGSDTQGCNTQVSPNPVVQAQIESARNALLEVPAEYVIDSRRHRHFDWFTAVLSAIILAIALVMGAVLTVRMGWIKVSDHRNAHRPVSSAPVVPSAIARQTDANGAHIASPTTSSAEKMTAPTSAKPVERKESAGAPEGTLFVYEGGKEIFRTAAPSGHNTPPQSKPELISRVEPEYPAQALAQHIQGAVALDVRVGTDGRVQEIKVASGHPLLAEAAVAAVRQWRFKPYLLNGQPKETETQITLKFTLPN